MTSAKIYNVPLNFLVRTLLMSAGFSLGLAACGGGGGGNGGGANSPSAKLIAPSSAKTPWNLSAPIAVTLTDSSGAAVTGALTCSSADESTLKVISDCSAVTGLRLGSQTIKVSSGNITANTTIKVIPQTQPLGTHGPASSGGSGQYNLVVTPEGTVLAWGGNT